MASDVTWSYHTHNEYCDGEGGIADVIEAALAAGLDTIGISSHVPLPFETSWAMAEHRLADYVREVRAAKRRYGRRIAVLLGGEIDYIPDERVASFQREVIFPHGFDYFVGSVHFLGDGYPPRTFDGQEEAFRTILRDSYGGDVQAMVEDYFRRTERMAELPHVAIIGHMDRIKIWNKEGTYWKEDEPRYLEAMNRALQAIAAADKVVELNTSGWRRGLGEPYPAPAVLARAREHGVRVTVSSDSHRPGQVNWGFDQALQCLTGLSLTPRRLSRVD